MRDLMHKLLYKQNGNRRVLGFGLIGLVMTALVIVGCSSNKHTSNRACASVAAQAFTLTPAKVTGGTSGGSRYSSSSGGSSSGGSRYSSNGGTSSSGGSSGGSRYSSNGGSSGGSNKQSTTSGSGGSNRYSSNGGTSAGSNSGTNKAPKVVTPPKGTKRLALSNEKAYTPPNNKVKQPTVDINAARASVQNHRFLRTSAGRYTSPVTHHTYAYHPRGYYTSSIYQDLYNPYDYRNYYNPFSPFYGMVYGSAFVASCN